MTASTITKLAKFNVVVRRRLIGRTSRGLFGRRMEGIRLQPTPCLERFMAPGPNAVRPALKLPAASLHLTAEYIYLDGRTQEEGTFLD
jgi:hypothetical protein